EQIQSNPKLVGATIMMLTSADHLGDAALCRKLGIAAYLVKPVRQSELLDMICKTLLGTPRDQSPFALPPVEKRTAGKNVRVLVAEDNPVNQRVAMRLLEREGYL